MPVLFPYEAGHHLRLPAAGILHFTYMQVFPSPVIESKSLCVSHEEAHSPCMPGASREMCGRRGPSREGGGRRSEGEEGPSHHLPHTCCFTLSVLFTRSLTSIFDIFTYFHKQLGFLFLTCLVLLKINIHSLKHSTFWISCSPDQ